jgi:hypothetical protein
MVDRDGFRKPSGNRRRIGRSREYFGAGRREAHEVISTRLTSQTATFGINYKFNWAQPVVAKY